MLISRSAVPLVVVLLLTPSVAFSVSEADQPDPWRRHVDDGRSAARAGQWPEAQTHFELALQAAELGASIDQLGYVLQNLALAHDAQHQFKEAKRLLERTLSLYEHEFPSGDPRTLHVVIRLGRMDHYLGLTSLTEDRLRRILSASERHFGEDHVRVVSPLQYLASHLQTTGRLAEAEAVWLRVISIFRAANDQSTAHNAISALAALYQDQRRFAEAESLLTELMTTAREAPFPERYVDHIRLQLAEVYRLQGRYTPAIEIYQDIIPREELRSGAESLPVAVQLDSYARLLRDAGREDERIAVEDRADALLAKHNVPRRPRDRPHEP
jgi:tetratricopeptide (TPR) repeat protein